MQENKLTDQQFWARYWESKADILIEPGPDYLFHDIFTRLVKKHNVKKTIELGGFPGYHSVYLKKFHDAEPTLLDYYVHRGILKQLIQKNGLEPDDIGVIEADLFNYSPSQTYDLVFSCGLIEHFEDTRDIIARHLPFLNEHGVLLITLPNFRGINGWFQRRYDPENYNKHVIESMNTGLLHRTGLELGLKNVRCYHYGKFSAWLENYQEQPPGVKALFKAAWLGGKAFTRLIPFESRSFSPYIVLEAEK